MGLSEKSVGPGWSISDDGLKIISENDTVKEPRAIYQNALKADLKEIGRPVLSSEIAKSKINELVLQIQKIRNVSAPKANEDSQAAPRMLKLTLTDGHNFCQGIEILPISNLSCDRTPPGSKILIKNARVLSGYIMLQPNNVSYLGGKVPALYEKWELSKVALKNSRRSSNVDGPPAWVNFGSKVQSSIQDQSFKSLDNKEKDVNKQNTEFDAQRRDAIAEASSTGAVKKVFGGGVKKPVNVQPYNNERRTYNKESTNKDRNNRDRSKWNEQRDKTADIPQKPSERVSLFHFLSEKLPPADNIENKPVNNYQETKNTYQANTNKNSYVTNNKYQQNYHPRPENNRRFENKVKPPRLTNENNTVSARTNANISNGIVSEKPTYTPKPNIPMNDKATPTSKSMDEKPVPTSKSNVSVESVTDAVNKMSVNSQFASRSLRQHLNFSQKNEKRETNDKRDTIPDKINWKTGDHCLAKYWEDGRFYNAVVTDVTENTCVVHFTEYGNMEEVLKSDCKLPGRNQRPQYTQQSKPRKFYSGPTEFRRNTNKQY